MPIKVTEAKPFPRTIKGRTSGETGIQTGLSVSRKKKTYPKINVYSSPRRPFKEVTPIDEAKMDQKMKSVDWSYWK